MHPQSRENNGDLSHRVIRVLMVEDSVTDCELVLRELRKANFAPDWTRVDTEPAFLEALWSGPDLILSDFKMPHFDGLRALELLRERNLDIPFILISGTVGEDTAVLAMHQGAADYLIKDRLARLGASVEHALAKTKLERERKLLEQREADRAHLLRDVLNSLPSSVVVLDENADITVSNVRWQQAKVENGKEDRQNYLALCLGAKPILGDLDGRAAAKGIKSVLDGLSAEFTLEYTCEEGGSRQWFSMHVAPLNGPRRGAVVTHEKITDRKMAEKKLRESEQQFRELIENSSDVIAVVNESGNVYYQSPSTLRVLGYRPEEVLGQPVTNFIHPDDQRLVKEGIERALSGQSDFVPVEYRIRHRDGNWRIFHSVGRAMDDASGERRVVVNARDMTDMHKLELRFLRAQRLEAVGTLSSGIAHDLNNILAPMIMIAPMLRDKLRGPQEVELLTMIEQGALRGANIIKQLLTFTRGVEGERGLVQAGHLLKEMSAIIRETFPRDIGVQQDIASNLLPVHADATQIHQVLMNLCVNARDAMPGGGKISLSAKNVNIDEDVAALHPPGRGSLSASPSPTRAKVFPVRTWSIFSSRSSPPRMSARELDSASPPCSVS